MILEASNIFNSSKKKVTINKLSSQYLAVDETYLFTTLNTISKMNKAYRESCFGMYNYIKECGDSCKAVDGDSNVDTEVISASMTEFFTTINSIISNARQSITATNARFNSDIEKLVNKASYVKKHINKLMNYTGDPIEMVSYKYTHILDKDIPMPCAYDFFVKDLEVISKSEIKMDSDEAARTLWRNVRANCDSSYNIDRCRGFIIGNGITIVYRGDFLNALYKKFRGTGDTDNHKYDSSDIISAASRFDKCTEIYKQVADETRIAMLKDIDDISSFIKDLTKSYEKDSVDLEDVDTKNYTSLSASAKMDFGNYIKFKVDQLSEILSTTMTAYSAKLDAMKECIIRDKNICVLALSEIKDGNTFNATEKDVKELKEDATVVINIAPGANYEINKPDESSDDNGGNPENDIDDYTQDIPEMGGDD